MRWNTLRRYARSVIAVLFSSMTICADERLDYFHRHVEPILKQHCFACHSHGSGQMEGGLALDVRSGWEQGGGRGPAVVPGDPMQSLLLRAVRHDDPQLRMPEERLSDEQIGHLAQWIAAGAADDRHVAPAANVPDPDWWSLRPLVAPPVPRVALPTGQSHGGHHPIDAFIRQKLQDEAIAWSPEADRRTLFRRLSFDLRGLPPTPQELADFQADRDLLAYEKLVDRLLASPHYGERWARHWLDTIHFADSHGYEHDVGRDHAWPYRDYVVHALNQDIAWDRFIREQLAVDVIAPDQPHRIPALGFLGAGTFDMSAYTTTTHAFDYLDRDDLVTQTTAAFLSTTANCARCHAHKFDPISQQDYYALQAVFAGIIKGDISYDTVPSVAATRARAERWLAVADKLSASPPEADADRKLIGEEEQHQVDAWLQSHASGVEWVPLQVTAWQVAAGTTLTPLPENAWLVGGARPETDSYRLTMQVNLSRITALRLELLPDDTLPQRGPGRQENGNLHLSEVSVQLLDRQGNTQRKLRVIEAMADFDQVGWGISRAIDGDPQTAWGIYPEVGMSHQGVFVLAEPITAPEEGLEGLVLEITLDQLHGLHHLIGAFRLSATCANASSAAELVGPLAKAVATPSAQRSSAQRAAIAAHGLRRSAHQLLQSLPAPRTVYAAAARVRIPSGRGETMPRHLTEPKTVHVLQRGDVQKPHEVALPGALAMLDHLPNRFALETSQGEGARRAALAEWIAHHDNVLTWRSIVNRVWHYHFGRGLCDTPSDLGRMGGTPSHPELLDWLAVWFRDHAQGSLKQLHRLIVTSATYRQSSQLDTNALTKDSENRWLWRFSRQRLDADALRDAILTACGTLDPEMSGPGVQLFAQSPGPQSTPVLDYNAFDWSQRGASRRSIYRYVWRGIADPFMESLDFPDLGLLTPARGTSSSALQALTLYNHDFVLYHSEALARQLALESPRVESQVTRLTERIWLREPTEEERIAFVRLVHEEGLATLVRVLLNSNEFLFVE